MSKTELQIASLWQTEKLQTEITTYSVAQHCQFFLRVMQGICAVSELKIKTANCQLKTKKTIPERSGGILY